MDSCMDMGMDAGMDGEEGRWLTYAELAVARGIDKQSAVKLAFRRHWRRQKDNHGTVQVYVPVEWTGSHHEQPGPSIDTSLDVSMDMSTAIKSLEIAILALQERAQAADARAERAEAETGRAIVELQVERARGDDERARAVRAEQGREAERVRADRAEQGREGERARADALRDRMDLLQAQLATVEAEGVASDVAIAELTAQLKEARRRAEEEVQAAEARREAEATARRSLGLVARLRAAWRGE